jgi:hypothetical protein
MRGLEKSFPLVCLRFGKMRTQTWTRLLVFWHGMPNKTTIFTIEWYPAVDRSSSLKKIPGAAARFVNHVCTLLCIELLANAPCNVEKSLSGEFPVEHDGASMFVVPSADTMDLGALMAETERLRAPAMEPQSRRIQNF